ncbi:hypothetical protein ACHAXT_010235 [Thalassiosira profunda]
MSDGASEPNDQQHEEEKAGRRPIATSDDGGGNNIRGAPSPTPLLWDESEGPARLHAPPAGLRPGTTVHAPKPLSHAHHHALADKLEEHLGKEGASFSSSFFSSASAKPPSPRPTLEGGPVPTFTPRERMAPKNEGRHEESSSNQGPQRSPVSSASLVVCGVDGTVYTLDAYTGQLRGMFASGPSLVSSTSPDQGGSSGKETNADVRGQADGADVANARLEGDSSNALTTSATPGGNVRVVPGLDGQLYRLFEFEEEEDGKCRPGEDGEYDDLDGECGPSNGESEASEVATRMGVYDLEPMDISVMDVLESPISACRHRGGDSQQKQCDIMVGSKKTTIYAIDPTTGKVRWTQDPSGGAGSRGYTAHPPKSDASQGRTVLLQREDYAVRQLDTEGGEQVMKVELGKFSALDFDVDVSSGDASSSGHPSNDDDDVSGGEGSDHFVGGRRRGAAAEAASKEKRKSGVPPILGRRKKASLHDFDSDFEHDGEGTASEGSFGHDHDDFEHDPSQFRVFPSIALSEDGTSLMAVDGYSKELLWKRQIDSVIAGLYGVGKKSRWIQLSFVDESEVFTLGIGHSPLPSPNSGSLVPYGMGQTGSEKNAHRLSRHHTDLFVSSDYEEPPHVEPDFGTLTYSSALDTLLPPRATPDGLLPPSPEDRILAISSSEYTMPVRPPPSHRTEHGLYLTWSMVSAIAMLALSLMVLIGRAVILRQKRKWENTPSLDPTTGPSSSEDGRDRSNSSGGILLPPAAQTLKAPLSRNLQAPVTRSFSLDALGSSSFGSRGANAVPSFLSSAGRDSEAMPQPDLMVKAALSPLSLGGRKSSAPTASLTTATPRSPTIARSSTLPTESPTDDVSNQQSRAGVDNIDGVPLVRYSRYRSEFEEMQPLGRGGFGTVFQCKNGLDSREYAIKKIKITSQIGIDGTVTKHFSQKLHRVLREVKILALLDHPNIVRYYTAWLEVDDGKQNEDEDTNASASLLDRKSQGLFSSAFFSGFGGSTSKAMQTSHSPKRSLHQRPHRGFLGSYNPLNFGSFRLDESQSEASSSSGARNDAPQVVSPQEEEDLGFTWERSDDNTADISRNVERQSSGRLPIERRSSGNAQVDTVKEEDSQSTSSGISSVDSKESEDKEASEAAEAQSNVASRKTVKLQEPSKDAASEKKTTEGRHILFIQMQLCSSQTLADFLASRQARSGSLVQTTPRLSGYAVDIPYALRLFAQIAHGVRYVHKQGLIHRDLKPQNCFIDEAGNVKVGDFGLSRESSTAGGITDIGDSVHNESFNDDSFAPPDAGDAENTAGVGTRAYASPEQMRGSNYDASTDVYSLGLILFELCYPMYTAMERYKEFGGIRQGNFPSYWNSNVKPEFPAMHSLLVQMTSEAAAERPSADAVSEQIDSLLREYSVQSLDKSWGKKGALLLRVEAEEKEGNLSHAMKLINDAVPDSTILQYGLRGQASKTIMEFALEMEEESKTVSVTKITSRLQEHAMTVRQISNSS